jgi:putative ABC transport system permease protein
MTFGYLNLVLKKILRDLRQGWLSFGACLAMLVLSVALFLAFYSASHSLERSTDATYQELNFLDFTLLVNKVSQTELARLASIPGVETVMGRTTKGIKVLLDPAQVPASRSRGVEGTLIGLPYNRRPRINDVHIIEGRYLNQARGEALLESRFARHHGIKVGDTLRVEVEDGSTRRFRLVGLVSSPEYIWMAVNRFDPRPVDKRYAVVFVGEQDAQSAVGGAHLNEIHVLVDDPASLETIIKEAESRMGPSLADRTVRRLDQPSHALLLRDRAAFRALAYFFPAIFLTLSSVTLFTTIWQLVSRQRRQIGILMSQGCSSFQLVLQYLVLGLVVGLLGSVGGVIVGIPLGRACTSFYTSILGLPFVDVQTPISGLLIIVGLSLVLSVLASWIATRRILKLDPIRAIRMEFQEGWAPRTETFLDSFLPTRLRFAFRNLARNPGRGLLSILGIAVSVAQIVMTLSWYDSQSKTLNYYFERVHQYDFEASMSVLGGTELPHVSSWPEVESVESALRYSAILEFESGKLYTNIWGITPESKLLQLYTTEGDRVAVSREPLIFLGPVQLARLGVRPGDRIKVSLHRSQPDAPEFYFTVASSLKEPLAHPPKMELAQFQRVLNKSIWAPLDGVNILLIKAKPGQQEALRQRLESDPTFNSFTSPNEIRDEVEDLLRMFNAYKTLLLGFTSIFALVVLLGTTTMNVMERTKEFATLSCLGVSDGQLTGLLLTETLVLWLFGLLLGIPAGLGLGQTMMNNFQSQLLQLDFTLGVGTVLTTAALSLLICVVAMGNGLARLRSLPLTAATQDAS